MKTLLLFGAIVFTSILTSCGGSETPKPEEIWNSVEISDTELSDIIATTYTMGYIVVAGKDFSQSLTWDDAIKACKDLGPGWRLPRQDELHEIYLHKDELGSFPKRYHWSSMEGENRRSALAYSFYVGSQVFETKGYSAYVRAVRDL